MKLAFAFVALLVITDTARADDPMPPEEQDEPNAQVPEDPYTPPVEEKQAEEPKPAPKARMVDPRPRFERKIQPRVRDDGDGRLEKSESELLGGRHWRIKTAQGAVHVWVPPGYDRTTAGTVVYVHGYWTDADGAWTKHELAKQFKQSRQNAMFVVPDAPAGRDESVHWPALSDLRRAVARANIKLPDGPVVVMGHSGAFRTVMQWVDHRMVDQIILLDAMYAGEHAFDEFIKSGKRADEHKLIVVGADVAQNSAAFASRYKFAVAREKVPENISGFTKEERRAKLLYIRSQFDHYAMITNKKVIPLLLRLTRLTKV
jgi:hypothetical protein